MTEDDSSAHRDLRELLGAFALTGLDADTRARVQAHLDGCPACRAELAEIAPLADALRRVSPAAVSKDSVLIPVPPPDLGERVVQRVAAERSLAQARVRREERRAAAQRRGRQAVVAAAAVVALVGAASAGTVFGRSTAPKATVQASKKLPIEDIVLRVMDASVTTKSAVVVAHGWGVEAKFEASGFVAGEVYRAAFRTDDGRLVPAGEFLGTGDKTLLCNMQSALLREHAAGFVVTDTAGQQVLIADF